jgi:hypothetical protein
MGLKDRLKGMTEAASAATSNLTQAASAATSNLGVGADAGQIDLANQAQKLMNEGVDTPAEVDSVVPTGKSTPRGYTEQTVTLTVRPTDGDPYEASATQYMDPAKPYNKGDAVTVKVDPSDRNSVMIFGRP